MSEKGFDGFINVPTKDLGNGRQEVNIGDIIKELKKGAIPTDNKDNVVKVDFQNKERIDDNQK